MAITASGAFNLTLERMFKNTAAIDLTSGMKVALFTNSVTSPNFDTNTAYGVAPFNANEIPTATGYTAGGTALVSPTVTITANTLVYDADNTSWASATFSAAKGALIYCDTVSDYAWLLVNFGADYSVTNGTFSINWDAAGIAVFANP